MWGVRRMGWRGGRLLLLGEKRGFDSALFGAGLAFLWRFGRCLSVFWMGHGCIFRRPGWRDTTWACIVLASTFMY